MAIKKGTKVRAIREKLVGSLEAQANDPRFADYIFQTDGEVVELRGDYCQISFGQVPTPPVWLHKDQLQEVG
jgi:hypothetical protein